MLDARTWRESSAPAHLDVIIVGAGISGIAAAHYLQERLPGKRYAILEARSELGGTWDLFRYPGIRSDSDMHSLGYAFRPWTGAKAIVDGASVLEYVGRTAREDGSYEMIRFHHRVVACAWSSKECCWTLEVEQLDTGKAIRMTCDFLWSCTGYYRYDKGYSPKLPGIERFSGPIIHPQHWPDDFDFAGKRIVVIGSGATAMTIVPAMARTARHVTMLQRSPTYVVALSAEDGLARLLRRFFPNRAASWFVRWKYILLQAFVYRLSRRRPRLVKRLFRRGLERRLPAGYDIDTHFSPRYEPWDQRVCVVPDGDLFDALSAGDASIVTDEIAAFTERGIELRSGEELQAHAIVTATGLNLLFAGGMTLSVDGETVKVPRRIAYKGMMLSGVPNFAFTLGYTNASWTLRVDLTCEYTCRLLSHMDEHGYSRCVPVPDPSVTKRSFPALKAGYVLRSIRRFPKQGSADPWVVLQSYVRDRRYMRRSPIDDGTMRFHRRTSSSPKVAS